MYRLVVTTAFCCLGCVSSFAQQNQPDTVPDAPLPRSQPQTTPPGASPLQNGIALVQLLQEKSRVFPDLATNVEPFGSWQKFKLAANNSVSLSTIGAAVVSSALRQASNNPSGYGQGSEGYAKRFGADMARSASSNLFGTFLLASALHEDPRFYLKRNLSFAQSVHYAAFRLLYTRSDSGEKVVDYSGLLGPLASEGLANTYYPDRNRGAGSTFTRYAVDLGWKFGGNLLRQYWPRINKKLRILPDAAAKASA